MVEYCFGAMALVLLLAALFLFWKRKFAESIAFMVFSGVAAVMVWLP